MDESMEDVAMNGNKIEKTERKRLRKLEKVKRLLNVEEAYNEEPLEAMQIVMAMMNVIEGLKDPVVKALLGDKHKVAVNGVIDAVTAIKSVAKMDMADLLKKV